MIPIVHYHAPAIVLYKQQNCRQVSFGGSLKMLESQKIWSNFDEISKIYRKSGHNKEISKYLKERFIVLGFDVNRKPDGTICASRNLNSTKTNAIILQAHMDIVSISADGNPKKPIEMHIKDGWLYANDRTLGADNGVGVSAMLTIAEDPKFKKYPLEMIITTDEETSMIGAKKLKASDFYGKYLVNLDSEKYGVITKGCAGISGFKIQEEIKTNLLKNNDYKKISINILGAKGGHSAEIQPDSLNPIKVLISELKGKDIKLSKFSGGELPNSIPRKASVEILVLKNNADEIEKVLKSDLDKMIIENKTKNPELEYSILVKKALLGTKYVDSGCQTKLLNGLDSIPTGLMSKFEDTGSTKTSQNFGVLNIQNGKLNAQIMGRSSDIKEGKALQVKTSKILSAIFEKEIKITDQSPIWQPKNNTILEEAAVKAYSDISKDSKPAVQVEHGGLEPASFAQTKPELEQISIGPTIEEPHSTQERVKIDTVIPFYNWLSKVIELLPKN